MNNPIHPQLSVSFYFYLLDWIKFTTLYNEVMNYVWVQS